jgi:hypothetical protein
LPTKPSDATVHVTNALPGDRGTTLAAVRIPRDTTTRPGFSSGRGSSHQPPLKTSSFTPRHLPRRLQQGASATEGGTHDGPWRQVTGAIRSLLSRSGSAVPYAGPWRRPSDELRRRHDRGDADAALSRSAGRTGRSAAGRRARNRQGGRHTAMDGADFSPLFANRWGGGQVIPPGHLGIESFHLGGCPSWHRIRPGSGMKGMQCR